MRCPQQTRSPGSPTWLDCIQDPPPQSGSYLSNQPRVEICRRGIQFVGQEGGARKENRSEDLMERQSGKAWVKTTGLPKCDLPETRRPHTRGELAKKPIETSYCFVGSVLDWLKQKKL